MKIEVNNPIWLELKNKVNDFVETNPIRFLELFSWLKFSSAILVLFSTYFVLLTTQSLFVFMIASFVFSICLTNIGFIAHCITHISFFKNKKINSKLKSVWDFFSGISGDVWNYKHNAMHHTYTNIVNKDEDIDTGNIFYYNKFQKKQWFHKYQWLYVWPIYALKVPFMHIFYNIRYFSLKKTKLKDLVLFFLFKAFYFVPMSLPFFRGFEFAMMYLFFFLFPFGMIISFIFAPAHLFVGTKFFSSDQNLEFLKLQCETTSNYAPNVFANEILSGLNYQLEHHLFPQTHYAYYPKINKIIKEYLLEKNLTYTEHKSFFDAVVSHIRFLKNI